MMRLELLKISRSWTAVAKMLILQVPVMGHDRNSSSWMLPNRFGAEQEASLGNDRFASCQPLQYAKSGGRFLAGFHGPLEKASVLSLNRKIDDAGCADGLDGLFRHHGSGRAA